MAADPDPEETVRGFLPGLSRRFLKPARPGAGGDSATEAELATIEYLEDVQRYADDRERLIGLSVAPLGGLIGLIIVSTQLSHDTRNLSTGKINTHYASPNLLHFLLLSLLALSVIMLAAAWYRKRLPLGAAAALYGLSVFNLRFWAFGFPFILIGSWYLVRAYRANQNLKRARGEGLRWVAGGDGAAGGGSGGSARPSKRYTPPTKRPKPLPPADTSDE